MAEAEIVIPEDELEGDEEMVEVEMLGGDDSNVEEASGLEDIEPDVPGRTTFLDYLRSPIVELVVGKEVDATTLFAHQGLLVRSPYLAQACEQFSEATTRRLIDLPDDDLDAVSAVVEYLYKNDYFPTLFNNSLEYDPTAPQPDNEGIALLRHARVYTLAQRFGLPQLCTLAHRKIHLTSSNARGEIAYARFVYKETSPDDQSIRKPVAVFWASRSHVLRHEAEQDFKRMCLEFPQFAFDVLSLVLDKEEKKSQRSEVVPTVPGRKRQRMSQI